MTGCRVALAGNPNVGKSTLFNALTGLRQHTGNWPGKTVATAQGTCRRNGREYQLLDLPGTYSLLSHSPEEQIARSCLCAGQTDAVVVVCDATCLERNLILVLQILEITPWVLVCVNLLDEARRKGIQVDLPGLSRQLGVPVVGIVAQRRRSAQTVLAGLDGLLVRKTPPQPVVVPYPAPIEKLLSQMEDIPASLPQRFGKLKQLEGNPELLAELHLPSAPAWCNAQLEAAGIGPQALGDALAAGPVARAEEIAGNVVTVSPSPAARRDRRIDRVLTGKYTGSLVMLSLLALIFWLTIVGANWVSGGLQRLFDWGAIPLGRLLSHGPDWIQGLVMDGAYRTTAWVCAVMLPPMAIFFPLFTLLEDVGYLPRLAYNLDKPFCRCDACGKQALTMCMGFGCNAAGVVGCRIIDSPRERMMAILTNSLVPCNGRFPLLLTMLTLFFCGSSAPLQAGLLTLAVLLSVAMTLLATKLLSVTLLKGQPSAFTLELPPYRLPQVGKILVRSVLDRSLFVLGRAVQAAIPAGMLIWVLANLSTESGSLLSLCADCLNPIGQWLGLDGVILLAFVLGLPANEIVLPIALMAYLNQGSLTRMEEMHIAATLAQNGWDWRRALCLILFTLFHWPCSTTLLTIRRETGSRGWTALALLLPTVFGVVLCRVAAVILF